MYDMYDFSWITNEIVRFNISFEHNIPNEFTMNETDVVYEHLNCKHHIV